LSPTREGAILRSVPTPLFRKIDCLSIPVADLDAALAFYSQDLGHELIWRSSKAASKGPLQLDETKRVTEK
jgi:hypothetical protein